MKLSIAIAAVLFGIMIWRYTGSPVLGLCTGACCYLGGTLNSDHDNPTPV